MWASFFRENGRWSLFHKIASDGDSVVTDCGWEYDASLERRETERPFRFAACIDCWEGTQPEQDEIRATKRLEIGLSPD